MPIILFYLFILIVVDGVLTTVFVYISDTSLPLSLPAADYC